MKINRWLSQLLIFPVLILVSFLVGWFIPAFYDWTGSDQSRPSPWIGYVAWALLAAAVVVGSALPWLPISSEPEKTERTIPFRFTIRSLLVVTTIIAVVVAVSLMVPMVVGILAYGIALGYVVRFLILSPSGRWQVAALLACMMLPFVWILGYDELSNLMPAILWMATGLPTLLPTMLVAGLTGKHPVLLGWLSLLLTASELVVGIWMIRLGPKRTIAYLFFVLLMSTFGSFVFNAMVRM